MRSKEGEPRNIEFIVEGVNKKAAATGLFFGTAFGLAQHIPDPDVATFIVGLASGATLFEMGKDIEAIRIYNKLRKR